MLSEKEATTMNSECAAYCGGQCDPFGATCWKGARMMTPTEAQPERVPMLENRGREYAGLAVAVAIAAIGIALALCAWWGGAR